MEDAMIANGQCPPGCGKWFLPLSLLVPASSQATLTNKPQRPYRMYRLYIPSSVASDLVVNDFLIANQSQFAAKGRIGGQIFSEDARDTMVCYQPTWDTNDYDLVVTNLTGSDVQVDGAALGFVRFYTPG